MTLVAVVAAKQSPGATTLALALAAAAGPEHRPLVVEADRAGGDVASTAGLSLDPGLMTLAAAGRRGITLELVQRHTQTLGSGSDVVLAPPSAEQAASALHSTSDSLGRALADCDRLAVLDCGRWSPGSASTGLIAGSDTVLIVFRPTVSGVGHVQSRLASLDSLGPALIAVAVGNRPYTKEEVSTVLHPTPVCVIEDDPRAASAITSGAPLDRWLRRAPLLRSASSLLALLPSQDSPEMVAP